MKRDIKARIPAWHIELVKVSWFCKHKFKPMIIVNDDISAMDAIRQYFWNRQLGVSWKLNEVRKNDCWIFKVEGPNVDDMWDAVFKVSYGIK